MMAYDSMARWLDDSQLDRLSEIAADIGQVFFATMVVGPFLTGVDKLNPLVAVLGLGISLGFWMFSVRLAKER